MTVIADKPAEEAILGAVALGGGRILPLLHQKGLRPDHFYWHPDVWAEVLTAADVGPVDEVTVPPLVEFLGRTPDLGNLEAYARRVMLKAWWRDKRAAGLLLLEASDREDEGLVGRAEALFSEARSSDRVYSRDRLRDLMENRLGAEKPSGWRIHLLDRVARPGTVWLWGGHTSHGKSALMDQIARDFYTQGANVWTWLNEMTAEERALRHAAATTGIPLEQIEENALTADEKRDVVAAMAVTPFQVVECPGWGAEEIARDIRMRQPDVAMIDIVHKIPYETERDLGRISRVLGDAAKLANCVIMATVHLNRGRIDSAVRPVPTLSDIKGASSFEQDADVIGFVWREDNAETGRPKENGIVTLSKFRMGKLGGVPVWFQGSVATFNRAV